MNRESEETIYQNLATIISQFIPFEWNKIYLYFECEEGVVSVHYVVFTSDNNRMNSVEMMRVYNIEKRIERKFVMSLMDEAESLYRTYSELKSGTWSTFTFQLNSAGDFKVDYGYEDLFASSAIERRSNWEKKFKE